MEYIKMHCNECYVLVIQLLHIPLLLFPQYEEQYESKASYFFLRNYNYSFIEIYIHHGYTLHRVLFIINTLIPR